MSDYQQNPNNISQHNKDFYEDDLTSYKEPHIRLLLVEPGRFHDPVCCRLKSYPLQPDLVYEALSYAWGDRVDQCSITVNSKPYFQITESAFGAVRRIRHATKVQYLWVDQFCINQANLRERSAQVAMMADIFSCAELVHVWLGPCGRRRPLPLETEVCGLEHPQLGDRHCFVSRDSIHQEPLCETDDDKNLKWWWRAWAVQEFALARRVEVLIGSHSMSWDEVLVYFTTVDRKTSVRLSEFTIIGAQRSPVRHHLRYLIELTSSLVASDPRDKIYGFLGLLHHDSQSTLRITPDYTKSPEEVFAEATRYLIENEKCLGILVENWQMCSRPSWAIDFSKEPRSRPRSLLRKGSGGFTRPPQNRVNRDGYRACGESIPELRLAGQHLIVRGIDFDLVRRVAAPRLWEKFEEFHQTAVGMLDEEGIAHELWESSPYRCIQVIRGLRKSRKVNYAALEKKSGVEEQYARTVGVYEQLEKARTWLKYDSREHEIRHESGNPKREFADGVVKKVSSRTFFITRRGLCGIGHPNIRSNDVVVVLLGCIIPVVLRPSATGDTYTLVGECIISGIMQGELMTSYEKDKTTSREFCIV